MLSAVGRSSTTRAKQRGCGRYNAHVVLRLTSPRPLIAAFLTGIVAEDPQSWPNVQLEFMVNEREQETIPIQFI
ncbi:MAG: hypothetical protein ACI9MC_002639 [Kiritimatiellia bacterium]|jgi:hypothetical protein